MNNDDSVKNLNEPDTLEAQFLTSIKLITDRFNCEIKEINFDNHVIDIDCPDETEADCARQLAELFDKYLV